MPDSVPPPAIVLTVDFRLSVLIGTLSHPNNQKIWLIGFFFENRLHWQFSVGCYCLQTVLEFKLFDNA
jgi:hypothetical protein